MQYEMLIKEIFKFQDDRIVFVGEVVGEEKFIKGSQCEILIDDQFFCRIHIEGEMLPCNSKSELRSISTLDKIDVSQIPYKSKLVLLRNLTISN
ncbi:MAG: hypothetical protein AABY34_04120 [Pseudomonadota bacterium]